MKKNLFFLLLALLLCLPGAIVYASSYTGPGNRTVSGGQRCVIVLYYCTFIRGDWNWNAEQDWACASETEPWLAWPQRSGSCTAAREYELAWHEEWRSDVSTTYPPVSTSRTVNCGTPGNSGWCRGNLTLTMNASEPIPGQNVIRFDNHNGLMCNPANAPSITCTVPITQQGAHTSDFWALSTWGDTSLKRAYSWSLDSLAPALTSTASGTQNGDWYTANVTLNLSGTDATSGIAPATYRYRINGGAWQSGSSLVISNDGVDTIHAEVQDVAGNTGAHSLTIRLDKTPPTLSPSVSGTQQNGWFRTAVETAANASDATSGLASVQHRVNGGVWQDGANVTISADGTHTLAFRVTDNAGHVTTREVTFSVDRTPPVLAYSLPAPVGANGWHTAAVEASLSASDALSGPAPAGLRYRVNGGPWLAGSGLFLDADGLHSVEIQGQDLAGNVGQVSFNVAVDRTPPALSVAAPDVWLNTAGALSATASDVTSGIAAMAYRLAGGAWQPGDNLSLGTEGIHQVEFRATDNAGHATIRSVNLQIDLTAPTITAVLSPDGLNGWHVSHPLIPLSALDGLSGVMPGSLQYRRDGLDWTAGEAVQVSQDGTHLLEARATDRAGNTGEAVFEVRVDTTPPELEIVVTSELPEHNGWYREAVTVSAFAADAISGLSAVSYRLQTAEWQPGSQLVLQDGDHQLSMCATDVAGNMAEETRRIRVDRLPPHSIFASSGGPLSGVVLLSGNSVDATSGIAHVEHSLDGGLSWQFLPHSDGAWIIRYDTSLRPDGEHSLLVRASDTAGNLEAPVALNVLVNNPPPLVSISKSWWIWESGRLVVQPGVAPLGTIRLQIACPGLQDVVLEFMALDRLPGEFTWDRRCGDGILAAPGEYQVTLTACTIHGRCASDTGVIRIAADELIEEAATPAPTYPREPTPIQPPHRPTMTPVPLVLPVVNEYITQAPDQLRWPLWLLPLVSLVGLVLALGATHTRDPRPQAVEKLADMFARNNECCSQNHNQKGTEKWKS